MPTALVEQPSPALEKPRFVVEQHTSSERAGQKLFVEGQHTSSERAGQQLFVEGQHTLVVQSWQSSEEQHILEVKQVLIVALP